MIKLNIVQAIQRIKDCVDVAEVLRIYGAKNISVSPTEIRCSCILHGGDNETAFSYNLEKGVWSCFTHHCGSELDRPRDIITFVQLAEGRFSGKPCSMETAIRILAAISGVNIDVDNSFDKEWHDSYLNQKWCNENSRMKVVSAMEIIDEEILKEYRKTIPQYAYQRGFTKQVLDEFEVGFSPTGIDEDKKAKRKDFPGRIIFPIRDEQGQLVGLSGRLATDDEKLHQKYGKHRHKYNFSKGLVLYNIHKAAPHIQKTGYVIVCEGPFDVMRIYSFGVPNVVAVLGSSCTQQQARLMAKAMNVYVCLDGDDAGQKGAKRIAEMLDGLANVYNITLPNGKDPGELTEVEFWEAFGGAQRIEMIN